MANKSPNLKVNVTADNSDLNRKMKDAKSSIRDFEKVSTGALDQLGSALGVNVGKIEQVGSALRGLGSKLQESGNTGAAAFGKVLSNVSAVGAGIAGLGIAGAVASFKLLNDEANAFKGTIQGANIEMQTAAYVATYIQALHDANEEVGKGMAEAMSEVTKKWQTFWADAKFLAVSTLAEIGKGSGSGEGAGDRALAHLLEIKDVAGATATEGERLAGRMYEIQLKIAEKTVEWARMEKEIAEYKRIAYDKTVDTVTQTDALNRASEMIQERYKEEAKLRKQLADLQEQYNDLASSSLEDVQKAQQLRAEEENVMSRMNNALRELSERQHTVALAAQAEAKARQESLLSAQRISESRASLQSWTESSTISEGNTLKDSLPNTLDAPEPGIAIPVTPQLDVEKTVEITHELESILTSSFEGVGMAVGQLIGDLATGGDAWDNFANTAISAFGDMAISVGRMAIQTGVATLGIKAALESLNGYVAIAAGVALVALGSAIKSGLSNVASGSYSYSSSVASAGGYSQNGSVGTNWEAREMKVEVVGTLRASGNELLTVIENEQTRKKHTT